MEILAGILVLPLLGDLVNYQSARIEYANSGRRPTVEEQLLCNDGLF